MLKIGGVLRKSPPPRHVPPARQSHFIVKWDKRAKRYVCECGDRSETATDFEKHKLLEEQQ